MRILGVTRNPTVHVPALRAALRSGDAPWGPSGPRAGCRPRGPRQVPRPASRPARRGWAPMPDQPLGDQPGSPRPARSRASARRPAGGRRSADVGGRPIPEVGGGAAVGHPVRRPRRSAGAPTPGPKRRRSRRQQPIPDEAMDGGEGLMDEFEREYTAPLLDEDPPPPAADRGRAAARCSPASPPPDRSPSAAAC